LVADGFHVASVLVWPDANNHAVRLAHWRERRKIPAMGASDFSHTDLIGSIIGLIGIILAIIFYYRGKEQAMPSYATLKYLLISPPKRHLPEKVKIEYDGDPISTLSTATILFWNRGRKTLDGADIATSNPVRFHFASGAADVSVLDIRSLLMTRQEIGVSAQIEGSAINVSFDFLDRGDGFSLEVFYAGDARTEITCPGTIKGVPRGARSRLKTASSQDKICAGIFSLESTRRMARMASTISLVLVAGVIVSISLESAALAAGSALLLLCAVIIFGPPLLYYYYNENIPRSLRRKISAQENTIKPRERLRIILADKIAGTHREMPIEGPGELHSPPMQEE
jgi:hypothetical protein